MTHPFDTDLDTALVDNPCCCCGKFDLAVAIVNCNGISDDNFDFYMSGSLLVSLTEPLPGTVDDPCTEDSLRNRGHWLTPTGYTGPHPTSSNLWCGAETTDGVLWDDHTISAFHDLGDACVTQFALRTTNNNGCNNFGHIYFYRVIKGDADATPPTPDSLCLMQTTDYQPTSYTTISSPTSGTYYCVYGGGRLASSCTNALFITLACTDVAGGPYTSDADCNDHCVFEYYYLVRCDNGDCCKGYWCIGGGQCYGPHTKAEAIEEADGATLVGPFIDADDCLWRGGCLPYWCLQYTDGTSQFVECVQGVSADCLEATYISIGGTVIGGPFNNSTDCASGCTGPICPCCPAFTTSPLTAVYTLPGVLGPLTFTLTFSGCIWSGSIAAFGGTATFTLGFNDTCHMTSHLQVPPFVGPTQNYFGVDPAVYDCTTMPYTWTDTTNAYNGSYGQVALSVPMMMAATAPAPPVAKPPLPSRSEAVRQALGPRRPCNCSQKRRP